MTRRHVRRYLDTADGKSTSNLRRHAKICWGENIVAAADAARQHGAAREIVEKSLKMPDRSITAMFELVKGTGKVTYSYKQHTRTESRYALGRALLVVGLDPCTHIVPCQCGDCSLGGGKHASLQDSEGPRLCELDEDWTTGILHTFARNCLSGYQEDFCMLP